jgi:hypothetical protein
MRGPVEKYHTHSTCIVTTLNSHKFTLTQKANRTENSEMRTGFKTPFVVIMSSCQQPWFIKCNAIFHYFTPYSDAIWSELKISDRHWPKKSILWIS